MPHHVSRSALPALAWPFLLAVLVCAAPANAQQRWHWPGAANTAASSPTIAAAQTAPASSGTGPSLQLEWQAPAYLAWVSNPLAGPAQVQLSAPPSEDYRAVPRLPLTVQLAAHERRLLARLYPASNQRSLGGLGLKLDVVPGDPQAHPLQQVRYQLPFRDAPIQVDQGFGGTFSHNDASNWYAVDFALPQGTAVLAAREGTVMEVRRDVTEGGPHDQAAGAGNLVRVLHADGSMAIYAHLAPDGVAVRPGQMVRIGERLGASGSTGFSTAPHLHFSLQRNADMRLISLPFRMLGPQGELQFPSPAP
ncbi:M23 family metallopeptidase [Xanthomonas arboricola]|uniref:M23 family metallopeptidase n=2 Tax=Xanthomonas arboricola pv. pruni TaxID=69929 RepID=A0AAP4K6M6_9XANT|nr:M23 family metallopeptidase [Xanthomonas arboricola]KCW99567.1 peptidase [Xanthomonas arboricola pv. pruni]MDN0264858.1 M23 family metallopeptidase [Xanthomonas arboricola pv. pruni]MDN0268730.1 M23 family metallopeptidase [Xanthomonas arboricola pv. pruni]MDN0272847.1 M23 family metallopeptidase [Xanthomonas arboricola pv. pruni]MDN0281129.1 M23 family metallopeptidase [Xanthomonas arboricola pv. pruni]